MPLRLLFINAVDTGHAIETLFPPLGLGYLASSLRKRFGSDAVLIKVIDRDVERELEIFSPDLVGISAVSQNYGRAERYARSAKEKGLPVMVGGVHISMAPATLSPQMDVGVLGEGEETVCELVALFLDKGCFDEGDLERVPGIVFRKGGEIATTPTRPAIEPLDLIPFPARDLLQIEETTYLFTSRGCPYRCTFCASTRFWESVRFFSAEYVAEEIATLVREYGVKHINFQDDLFMLSHPRIERITELLRQQGLLGKVRFSGAIRANLVNDKVLGLLREMGVDTLSLGLESGCDETLSYLKAGSVTVQQNRDAVRMIKNHGMVVGGSFIIGAPHESREDVQQTVDLVKELELDGVYFYVLTPFPGTPVWDYARSRGLVSEEMEWERLRVDFGAHPEDAIIVSDKLTRQEIIGFYRQIERYLKRRRLLSLVKNGLRAPWRIPGYLLARLRNG